MSATNLCGEHSVKQHLVLGLAEALLWTNRLKDFFFIFIFLCSLFATGYCVYQAYCYIVY